ncbi:hypothetical protein [Nevskia ramosa]|nr:hypothetical protein [Nevskia ramosa]
MQTPVVTITLEIVQKYVDAIRQACSTHGLFCATGTVRLSPAPETVE